MRSLIKTYLSIYSLGIFFILVLYLAFFSPATGDKIFVRLGEAKSQEYVLGSRSGLIQNAQASGLEENPMVIKGANFDRGEGQVVYTYPKYWMTIIEISNMDMDYFYNKQNPPAISEIGNQNSCEIAVNASYFSGTKLDARHVGLLSITGQSYVPLGVENQLTHVAVFNKQSRTIEFLDASGYKSHTGGNFTEFQTGPLVLDNGEMQTGFIENSKNGMFDHKRLLLATDKSKKIFAIVVRKKVDLIELGEYLQGLEIFGEDLDIINLDGGKSVALWDKENPTINYNSNDRLPLVICFR